MMSTVTQDEIKKRLDKRRWSVSLSFERQQSNERGEQVENEGRLERTGR